MNFEREHIAKPDDKLQSPELGEQKHSPEAINPEQEELKKLNELKDHFPFLSSFLESKQKLSPQEISTLAFIKEHLADTEKTEESLKWRYELNNPNLQKPANLSSLKKALDTLKSTSFNSERESENTLHLIRQSLATLLPLVQKDQFERFRGNLDKQRVESKKSILTASPYSFDINQINNKESSLGRLTFEAFIDDLTQKKFTPSNSSDLNALYSDWEYYTIQTLSQKTSEQFSAALISSGNNNAKIKSDAQKAMEAVDQQIHLSPQEKEAKKTEINQRAIQTAKETNGMLNRQEILISGLINKSEKDLIRNLQIIGKYFYNENPSIDGIWGKQTQTILEKILEDFKDHPRYELFETTLNNLKKTHRNYNTQKLKPTFGENMRSYAFDSYTIPDTSDKRKLKEEKLNEIIKNPNEKKEEETTNQRKSYEELSKHSFEDIPEISVENSIPKQEYLETISNFLGHYEQALSQSEELSKIPRSQLITMIMQEDISTPDLKILNDYRNKSKEKQQLLENHKDHLQHILKTTASKAVSDAGEHFLEKFGVNIINKELIQENNGEYFFKFTGQNGMEYYYRPHSGNISTKSFNTINHKDQTLSLGTHVGYHIINRIPTYNELIAQAQSVNFLKGEHPNTPEELTKNIETGIRNNINIDLGEIEENSIKETIEKEQTKTHIAEQIKILFPEVKANLSPLTNPSLYAILKPFTNTLAQGSLSELKTLERLTTELQKQQELAQTGNQKTNDHPEQMTSLAQLKLNKPQDLFALITNQYELSRIPKEEEKNSGLMIMISWLEKGISGKDSEYNILNINKIQKLLDTYDNPNELQKPEYQSLISALNKTYPKSIENRAKELEKRELTTLERQIQNT